MRYRRRLRSRIIITFFLFGITLTTLFAVATRGLRGKLEDQLINDQLQHSIDNFMDFKRNNPDPEARFPFSPVVGDIYRASRFANVPFDRQKYDTGVYDIVENDERERPHSYKLAVRKTEDFWAFIRYDTAKEELSERQLLTAVIFAVVVFSVLGLF